MRDEFKKDFFEEDEIENPFKDNRKAVISGLQAIITGSTEAVRGIKNAKSEFIKQINKCRKDAKKQLSEVKRDKYASKETKDKEKEKATKYLSMMSAFKKVISGTFSGVLKIVAEVVKECTRLYTAGGEYIKRKQDRIKEAEKRNGKNGSSSSSNGNSSSSNDSDIDTDKLAKQMMNNGIKEMYMDADYNTMVGEMAVVDFEIEFDL